MGKTVKKKKGNTFVKKKLDSFAICLTEIFFADFKCFEVSTVFVLYLTKYFFVICHVICHVIFTFLLTKH